MEQATFDTMAPLRHQQRTTSRLSTKPTAKRQQPRQQPTLSAKTLHHNHFPYDSTMPLPCNHSTANTPAHLQSTNSNRANCPTDTPSTLRGFMSCSALVAWTIYEQAITKALLALPTQFSRHCQARMDGASPPHHVLRCLLRSSPSDHYRRHGNRPDNKRHGHGSMTSFFPPSTLPFSTGCARLSASSRHIQLRIVSHHLH